MHSKTKNVDNSDILWITRRYTCTLSDPRLVRGDALTGFLKWMTFQEIILYSY